jgi:hypothetical protein
MSRRENRPLAVLLNVLPDEWTPEVTNSGVRVHASATVRTLTPLWVGEGLPADVRRGIGHRDETSSQKIVVLTARRMSSGSRALLADAGVSWADETGHATIQDGEGLYLARLPAARRLRDRTMPWSPAVAATAEIALELGIHDETGIRAGSAVGTRVPRASSIAELSGYSYPQVAKILSAFDDQGYTRKAGAERGPSAVREFTDPGRLLSDWAGYYARASTEAPAAEFHVPWRSAEQSLDVVRRMLPVRWSISGAAGADRVAPHLTQVTEVLVYVDELGFATARRTLLDADDVTEVESGGRIRLCSADAHVLALSTAVADVLVAPAARIYGDLLRARGRSAEAADHLRETVLGF